jgi:UDP-hydrolysing UDP-N-acetyl-D-glucosamine 2-epimerase
MMAIKDELMFKLQTIVTGAHLSRAFGLTYKEIEKDGFCIHKKIRMLMPSRLKSALSESMGLCAIGVGRAFEELKPDLIIVLGDRYELLPICSAAVVMNIPIAHISGGDITEGAIDDQIRHAVTKMSHLHFPGNAESAKRIIQMGEDPSRVFNVGELGIDNFYKFKAMSRTDLSEKLGLNVHNKWILCTYHPETLVPLKNNLNRVKVLINVLSRLNNTQTVFTYPNADFGSSAIIDLLKSACSKNKDRFKLVDNLGQIKYLSMMKESYFIVGNSSSIIFESPSAKIPAINIGDRQKGRILSKNIITVTGSADSIRKAISKINSTTFGSSLKHIVNPYSDGHAAEKIVKTLKKTNFNELCNKKFFETCNN